MTDKIGLGKGIRIYVAKPYSDIYTYQIFIADGSVVSLNPHCLAYEGVYRQYVYFPFVDTSIISIMTRFVHRDAGTACSTHTIHVGTDTGTSELYATETPIQFCANNINPNANINTEHVVVSNFALSEAMVINRTSCSLNQGAGNHSLQDTEQLWIQPNIMGSGGYVRIKGTSGTYLSMYYDIHGQGWHNPRVPVVIPSGEVLSITIQGNDLTKASNPLGLNIILYTIGGWKET